MKKWILLNEQEYRNVWDRFYDEFAFNPNIDGEQSFKFSRPYIAYDISDCFEGKWTDEDYNNFDQEILRSLIACTKRNEYIYALDWQHDSYWMNRFWCKYFKISGSNLLNLDILILVLKKGRD